MSKRIKKYDTLRPCIVDGLKGLFHTWEHSAEIIPPSNLVGGHSGGQLSNIFGVVEFEDGKIVRVYAEEITFLDSGNAFREKEKYFTSLKISDERKSDDEKKKK